MADSPHYSVVLPAYLEEENLRLLLPRLRDTLAKLEVTSEIIVIDTVTPMDGTAGVCEQLGVKYVNRSPSNAFGDAVRTGIREATGDWIAFMDADGSHAPEFLLKLFEQTPGYDIAIASRYVHGGQTENSKILMLMSRLLNATYSLFLDLHVRDVSNSFKVYRGSLLKELKLTSDNFDIIQEILVQIVHQHPTIAIVEIPFAFKKRMFGKTKRNLPLFIMSYIFTIVKLRRMVGGMKPTTEKSADTTPPVRAAD